jgi:hypothetical protein
VKKGYCYETQAEASVEEELWGGQGPNWVVEPYDEEVSSIGSYFVYSLNISYELLFRFY